MFACYKYYMLLYLINSSALFFSVAIFIDCFINFILRYQQGSLHLFMFSMLFQLPRKFFIIKERENPCKREIIVAKPAIACHALIYKSYFSIIINMGLFGNCIKWLFWYNDSESFLWILIRSTYRIFLKLNAVYGGEESINDIFSYICNHHIHY